jgi:hypothetical protein
MGIGIAQSLSTIDRLFLYKLTTDKYVDLIKTFTLHK